MSRKYLARDITIVGNGGAAIAGLTTTVLGIGAGLFSLPVAPLFGAIAGLSGFIIGAVGSYLYKDELLKRAKKFEKYLDKPKIRP